MFKKQKIKLTKVLSFSWKILCSEKIWLFISIFLIILSTVIEIWTRYMYWKITDALVNNSNYEIIISLFIGWIIIEILHHITRKWASLAWWSLVLSQCMKKLYTDSFNKIQHFSNNWFNNNFIWAIIKQINRGVYAFERLTSVYILNILAIATVFIWSIMLLFFYSPILWIIALLWWTLFLIFVIFISNYYVVPRYRTNLEADTKIAAMIADSITGNITIKSFAQEKKEYNWIDKQANYWMNTKINSWIANDVWSFAQNILLMLMQIILVLTSLNMWKQNLLSIWDIVFIIFLSQLIWAHLAHISQYIRDIMQSSADLEDIIKYNEAMLEISDKKNAKNINIKKWNIEFKNVNFKYKNQDSFVFKKFSINIKAGQRVAIVWKSWAWKSTFIKLIKRFYDTQSWEIFIDKQNIASVTQKSLRKNIWEIPQDPILFHRTLEENISYAKTNASTYSIIDSAKKAHAHEFISKLPQAYKTLVWERWVKLSWWERQRIAIARAILADTPIIILDEATSSLDSESEKFIQDSIHTLLKKKTAIIIAHRLSTIKEVDRILVFDEGEIVEDWTFNNLQKRNGIFAKLWKLQKLD